MHPKISQKAPRRFICAALVFAGTLSVNAASVTWTGLTGSDFEVGNNWGGVAPGNSLASDVGVFAGSVTANMPSLSVSRSIAGLNFLTSGWSLGGTAGTVLSLGTSGITSVGTGTNAITVDVGVAAAQSWNVASGNTLNIAGQITGTNAVTVSGAGLLKLSGSLALNGAMIVSSGTVNATQGGYIGTSGSTGALTLNGGTFISGSGITLGGSAVGTQAGTITVNSGTLDLGSNTLTVSLGSGTGVGILNMNGGTLNAGSIFTKAGSSSIFNFKGGTVNVSGVFSSTTLITLGDGSGTAATLNLTAAGSNFFQGLVINADGALNVTGTAGDQIRDGNVITLNGGRMNYNGSLSGSNSETYTSTVVNQGNSTITLTAATGKSATLISGTGTTAGLTRTAGATILFRGTNLGVSGTGAANGTNLLFNPTISSQLVGTLTSGSNATNLAILPYAVGDTSATGLGSDFVTYDSTRGIRTLTSSEYVTSLAASATDSNVKLSTAESISAAKTINSLVVNSGTLSNSAPGTGVNLTVTAGAILATGSGNAIGVDQVNFGSREGIVTVNNDLLISSVIAGTNGTKGLTKSGSGTLTLSGSNTYTGATTLNQGTIKISADNQLGNSSGGIVFSGGALNTTASGTTARAITLNSAGGTFNPSTGTRWTYNGVISGSGGLTVNGAGAVVLGTSNTYTGATTVNSGTLQLGANNTMYGVTIGGSGPAVFETSTYKATLGSGTMTINSGGVLQISGTAGTVGSVTGDIVVNSGGTIQSLNTVSVENRLSGNVTLNSGATISTNSGTSALAGRLMITGDFIANAGSTISSNWNGYLGFTGTNITIGSGVTLTSAGSNPQCQLTLNKNSGTQFLTSATALDTVFIRDNESAAGTSATAVLTVSATGGNIGQILLANIDAGSTTTARLGSNLTVASGKGIINVNPNSSSTKAVALDLNGYTYDASNASSSAWTPGTGTNTSTWSVLSTSGTGTFRAGYFTLTGSNTDVSIGQNVVLSVGAGNTSDLGLKSDGTGVGAIDATSTFLFEQNGTHYLKTTGTYANGSSRTIGNIQAGNGNSISTLALSSDITTGAGSAVTVNNGSTIALRGYNLTTSGTVHLDGGTISAFEGGTGLYASGNISATGSSNSVISAPVFLTSTGNQDVTVSDEMADLSISGAISGSAASITKRGLGSLTLTGSNTYTGATLVAGGRLNVDGSLDALSAVTVSSGAMLGGSGIVNGTTLVQGGMIAGNGLQLGGAVQFNGGTLSGTTTANSIVVASGTTTVDGLANATNGLTIASGATLGGTGTVNGTVGVNSGTINGSGLALGATTFTGTSTLAGTTFASSFTVSTGATLNNTGDAGSLNISVAAGATLTNTGTLTGAVNVTGVLNGDGTVDGALTIKSSGELATSGPGMMTVVGDLIVESGAKVSMQLDGVGGGIVISPSGSVTLAAGSTLDLAFGVALSLNDSVTLIDNMSSALISGTFSTVMISGTAMTLNANSIFTFNGQEYALSYTGSTSGDSIGNDLTLTVVPEPSTWAMLVGGLGVLCLFKRKRIA